ncbi:MAG: hypothetical protein FGM61_09400 [Sediminibacterium sp.]|nr:hypothetical protein [Sediminibacterium sp.]
MNLLQEKALYHVTGQMKNGQLAGELLEKIVSTYPYFGPAQSLLACYYQTAGNPSATEQAARATIFHPNPRWWAFQLEEAQAAASENQTDPFSPAIPPLYFQPPVSTIDIPDTTPATNFTTQSEASPLTNELLTHESSTTSEPPAAIYIPTVEAVKEILRKIDGGMSENIPVKAENLPTAEKEPEAPTRLTQMLQSQVSSFKQPVKSTDQLEYQQSEPLHTVDYFASQGIQLNMKQASKDALTKKLMSFTDWLRQVKNAEKSGEVSQMEKKVSEDAHQSVRREEIVTEAMAEVLLRQGHQEQAIQLFSKLSFQFPEKSSYFAARIEQIKAKL